VSHIQWLYSNNHCHWYRSFLWSQEQYLLHLQVHPFELRAISHSSPAAIDQAAAALAIAVLTSFFLLKNQKIFSLVSGTGIQ